MSDIILHQYQASPFSEKIRNLLGYKQASYKVVNIPVIMPKPDLMALTGGYRKTPVMQIGADIYCDSAIICRVIERLYPDKPIYPQDQEAALGAAVHWTDTFFFKVSVAMAFQPKALAQNKTFADPKVAEAFRADRAALNKGSAGLGMEFSIAQPHWLMHLKRLDTQLATANYLGGDAPNILDFSTYHCLWFVHNSAVLRDSFTPFTHVLTWIARMADFGNGTITEISGSAAIEIAASSPVTTQPKRAGMEADDLEPGDRVEILPIDYGFQPTQGTLLVASLEELVVARTDSAAGDVAVHFPRLGFRINKL
ncbi:MAG: glutathione S-transferase family protein [Oceanicoccus sp.]